MFVPVFLILPFHPACILVLRLHCWWKLHSVYITICFRHLISCHDSSCPHTDLSAAIWETILLLARLLLPSLNKINYWTVVLWQCQHKYRCLLCMKGNNYFISFNFYKSLVTYLALFSRDHLSNENSIVLMWCKLCSFLCMVSQIHLKWELLVP